MYFNKRNLIRSHFVHFSHSLFEITEPFIDLALPSDPFKPYDSTGGFALMTLRIIACCRRYGRPC